MPLTPREPQFIAPAPSDTPRFRDTGPARGASELEPARGAPLAPVVAEQVKSIAPAVLKYALIAPKQRAIIGKPLPLVDVVARIGDRRSQLQAVSAYWQVTLKLAEYNLAAVNELRFAEISVTEADPLRPLYAAEQAALAARTLEANAAVVAAQQTLADAIGWNDDVLPLPVDLPLVSSYRTSFREIAAAGVVPVGMKKIDRVLPLLKSAIEARATAAQIADEAFLSAAQNYARRSLPLSDVIAARRMLEEQQRLFLVVVRDYNQSIAEYALMVAVPSAAPNAVVAMLIESAAPSTMSVLVPEGRVRGASGFEPVRSRIPGEPTPAIPPATIPPAVVTPPAAAPSTLPPITTSASTTASNPVQPASAISSASSDRIPVGQLVPIEPPALQTPPGSSTATPGQSLPPSVLKRS